MKINNKLSLIISNLLRNKKNIIIIILLIIFNFIVIIGLSLYLSFSKFWKLWTNNSYDFNLLAVSSIDMDNENLIKELKSNSHVKDVFTYTEYKTYAQFNDYIINNNINGEVELIGTINGTKKIIYGSDLSNDVDGMICPNNFVASSNIYQDNFDPKSIIDLKNMIGKKINFKYIGKYDESLELVGIFDGTYDYSQPNACYVNHYTVKRLINKYQPQLNDSNMSFYVLIDDLKNSDEIFAKYNLTYFPVKTIKTDIGNQTLLITGIGSCFLMVLIFNLCYFIFTRRIIKEYKIISILKIVGYDNSKIKRMYIIETFIINIISYIISLVLALYISNNIVKWFFNNQPQLYLMKFNINIYILIVSFILSFVVTYLSTILCFKKIDSFDISELIHE